MSALSKKVLVLNRAWQVVDTMPVKKAIGQVVHGTAKIIGRDYRVYDFDEWVMNWDDVSKLKEEEARLIRATDFSIPAPEVIINNYGGFKKMRAKFSRRNIFLRDKNTCMYCGKTSNDKSLFNLDHVIPKSKGGKTTWDNIVLACVKCNSKKGNLSVKEAGMKLIKEPVKPNWDQVRGKIGEGHIPEFWKNFVDAAYWNVELKD